MEEESEPRQRMRWYAEIFEKLTIILLRIKGGKVTEGNLDIYPTAKGRLKSFFRAWRAGRLLLEKDKFDVISCQDPFGTGLIGYFLKLEFKLPLQLQIHTGVFTPHFSKESLKNRIYFHLAKILLARADCVRVTSEEIESYLSGAFSIPPQKVFKLPVFTDVGKFISARPKFDLHEKYAGFDFIILMASRFFEQKNIALALEAMRDIVDDLRGEANPLLLIVGSGPEAEDLKLQAAALNLQANVIFEPWADDLVSYYKTADLFLLTSNYEGWARTVIEAMACGLPVVMTEVGLARELLRSGENGVIIPVENREALVRAIKYLHENPEKRRRIAAAGLETVKNLRPRTKEEYLELYKRSLEICL